MGLKKSTKSYAYISICMGVFFWGILDVINMATDTFSDTVFITNFLASIVFMIWVFFIFTLFEERRKTNENKSKDN
jgi:hypothetical protein